MNFTFLVHLRDLHDVAHTIPFFPNGFVTRTLRKPLLWLFSRLHGRKGFWVRSTFDANGNKGHIIVIWLTGEQVMTKPKLARKRILEAALFAQDKLDSKIIGLGALTASVAGEWLASQPEIESIVTHGDHYATALAIEGMEKVVDQKGISLKDQNMAIVGATGIIGGALVEYFSDKVKRLILVGRSRIRLERKRNGRDNFIISTNINDIRECQLVFTATSATEAIIDSSHLRENAIVIEVSQPRNVKEIVKEERPDVTIIDGAYSKVPDDISFWWMSLPKGKTFGCMAETIMLSMLGTTNPKRDYVGPVMLDFVQELRRIDSELGFGLAELSSFNSPI